MTFSQIQRIDLIGNEKISDEKILKKINFEVGSEIDETEIERWIKEILTVYKNEGYLNASVSFKKEINTLKFFIVEGRIFKVGEIELEGNRFFSDSYLTSLLSLKPGTIFKENLLEEDVDVILRNYENSGFPFTKIFPQNFKLDNNRIYFKLKIEEGPLIRIKKIDVEGNDFTKDYVVKREMRIEKGSIYSQRKIEEAKGNLQRLNIFDVEAVELIPIEGGWVSLLVKIVEGRTNYIHGVLGYVPSKNGNPNYTGIVEFIIKNLFGTGRKLSAKWESKTELSRTIYLKYEEPWVFGFPLNVGVELYSQIEDTTYTSNSTSGYIEAPLFKSLTFKTEFGIEKVNTEDYNSTKYKGKISTSVDTRDEIMNPKRGILYDFFTEYGYKRISPIQPIPDLRERDKVVKMGFSLNHYLNFVRNYVIFGGIDGRQVTSTHESIAVEEQFKLGGTKTVRGYKEEQFYGSRMVWSNLELRFITSRKSRLYLFFDSGYLENTKEKIIYGYGAGVAIDSRLGIFSLDYGVGRDDRIYRGKIHLGLGAEF